MVYDYTITNIIISQRWKLIAHNLRILRKKKGLSQEKLARLADISLNTLTKIESGFAKKPTIQTVVKLAKALNISLDELVKNMQEEAG